MTVTQNLKNGLISRTFPVRRVWIILIATFPFTNSAQTTDSVIFRKRPAQLTLFYPIGTNGISTHFINNVSLNLLFGINGGVEGLELAGFANVDRRDVTGFQAAGFVNGAGGSVLGLQAAGFANFAGGDSKAGQAAGFMNVHSQNLQGLQAAGFMNINGGTIQGLQAAGFMNINGMSTQGVQAAGFANINGTSVNGLQAAGFANIASGTVNGLVVAGFMNINGYDVQGAQIAGFLNVARYVRGVQISVINICDSIQGVPIGLINIVQKGYRRLELFTNESFYFNLGFKMGVKHLYTIYTAGMQPFSGHFRYGLGIGIGSEIDLTDKSFVNIDAIATHVNENEWWTETLNLQNQLRVIFGYRSAENFSVYGGPTFNVMVSQYSQPGSNRIGSGMAPWTLYNRTINGTNIQIWPGLTAGFKF